MFISVVIPTFNRSRLLRQTLPALTSQTLADGLRYEVIFVSDGSTDDTEAVLHEVIATHPHIRYFRIEPTGGPSTPRNYGIREARGEVVIILDDDVLPEPELVLRHAEFHARNPERHHAAVGEVYVPQHLLSDPMSLFHVFPYDEVRDLDRLSFLHFWTCNVSFKRDFMLESGMFDEQFLFHEDRLVGYKLAEAGMHLHFLPSARGQHLHQLQPSGIPAKARFSGMWLYAFLQRLPDPSVKAAFDTVLSLELPWPLLAKRLIRRAVFHVVANPATMALLRAAGATRRERSWLTDRYYGWLFRRNMLAGYNAARRQARAGRRPLAGPGGAAWVDRGEPLPSSQSSKAR